MTTHQIRRGQLALLRNRTKEEKELDHLFLAQAAHLKSRPEPRSPWDDVARDEQRIPHPAHRAVACSRRAMQKALEEGGEEKIAATRSAILTYYEACAHAALADCPALPQLGPEGTFLAVMREAPEAITAVAEAHVCPSLGARALQEVREMVHAGERYLAAKAHQLSRSAAL